MQSKATLEMSLKTRPPFRGSFFNLWPHSSPSHRPCQPKNWPIRSAFSTFSHLVFRLRMVALLKCANLRTAVPSFWNPRQFLETTVTLTLGPRMGKRRALGHHVDAVQDMMGIHLPASTDLIPLQDGKVKLPTKVIAKERPATRVSRLVCQSSLRPSMTSRINDLHLRVAK